MKLRLAADETPNSHPPHDTQGEYVTDLLCQTT